MSAKRYVVTDAEAWDSILASVTITDELEGACLDGIVFELGPIIQTHPERKLVGFTLRPMAAQPTEGN